MKNKLLLLLLTFTLASCSFHRKGGEVKANEEVKIDSIDIDPVLTFPLENFNFDSVYKEYKVRNYDWNEGYQDHQKAVFYKNQYEKIIKDGQIILKAKPSQSLLRTQITALLNKKIAVYYLNDSIRNFYVLDSTRIPDLRDYDSLIIVNKTLDKKIDSITALNYSVAKELLHKKLVVENAKYYLGIVQKNSTQEKFLRGWMNRAFSQ